MIEQSWPYLAAGVILITFLIVLFTKALGKQQVDQSLSQKERMFASILEKAVGGQYSIYCKVPLSELFDVPNDQSDRVKRKAVKPLQGLQFDYIVCAMGSDDIVCAVELDDHEYHKKRHKQQDLFIEELCRETGLPLLRVAPQNGYNLVEIIERFERTISSENEPVESLIQNRFNLTVVDRYRAMPEQERQRVNC